MKWSEVTQSSLTLCDPVDCSPPGSSVHGIFQARILEWVAISFSILLWVTVQKSLKTNALGYVTSCSGRIIFYFHACKISCLPFMTRDSNNNLLQANPHLENQVRPQALPKLCGDVVKPTGSGIRLNWVQTPVLNFPIGQITQPPPAPGSPKLASSLAWFLLSMVPPWRGPHQDQTQRCTSHA